MRKKRRTVSVVGASEKSGRVRKKGGDCFSSWGKRKKRTSEERKEETVSAVGASEKSGRESEESTCHKSFLVLESYTYSYPGHDSVTQCDLTRSSDLCCVIFLVHDSSGTMSIDCFLSLRSKAKH